MLSVSAAQSQILARIPSPAPPEVVTVAGALGRVLAEDVRSTMDVPPTDNSAVDGYAVGAADIPLKGTRPLDVVADVPAGALYAETLKPGQALRIMTGAPIPEGADTVYPQEVVTRSGPRIEVPPIDAGANVRYRGEDVRAGAVVLGAGSVVRPQEMGVAASLGLARLLVRQRPRVAILSTGDEVAEPGGERAPAQIYDANRFTLRGLVEASGALATDCGIIPDRFDELRTQLLAAAGSHDVVLTSGGVSVGDHDLVKAVLQDTGSIDFWQVAMQPGRPVAVGANPGRPLLRPARQPGCNDVDLSPLRSPRAVEACRPARARRPAISGGGRCADEEEARTAGVQARAPHVSRPTLGGHNHRATGLRHPHIDDPGQLPDHHRGGRG